jgi:hypothetical protein
LFGDLGGVLEIFIAIFAIFVVPISEHSFILTALSRLFIARTDEQNLFQNNYCYANDQLGVNSDAEMGSFKIKR